MCHAIVICFPKLIETDLTARDSQDKAQLAQSQFAQYMPQGDPTLDSNYSHKQIIMQEASRQLDSREITGKVMSMNPQELNEEQEAKIQRLIPSERQDALKKIVYYDHSLDMKRKCEHFMNLVEKIKRKIVLKPFIEIDLARFQEDFRTPPQIMFSFLMTLVARRSRKAFDGLIEFVERRNELAEMWFYFMEEKLRRRQRAMFKEARAEALRSREQRQLELEQKNDLVKTQNAARILRNMLRQMGKHQIEDAFLTMKREYRLGQDAEEDLRRQGEVESLRKLAAEAAMRKESSELGIGEGFNYMMEKNSLAKNPVVVESQQENSQLDNHGYLHRTETGDTSKLSEAGPDEDKFVLERSRKGPLNMYAEQGSDFEEQSIKSETMNSPERGDQKEDTVDLTMGETADEMVHGTEDNHFENENEESMDTAPKGRQKPTYYL